MSIHVVQFANTFVARPGNIGMRTHRVLQRLGAPAFRSTCVCRGATVHQPGTRYLEMGWLGHLPRLLNAVRIYVAPRYNHRFADIALFEHFAGRRLDGLLREGPVDVAHVWDTCPALIRRLRRAGARVLLDVPIAPLTYSQRMARSGQAPFLLDDPRLAAIELEAFAEADRLIAPSRFVADELARAGVPQDKISQVDFGADVPAPAAAPAARPQRSGLDFCMVGAIGRRKGALELLQVWDDDAFRADRLHLCGRVYPEVSARLARLGGGAVHTPGFIKPADYLPGCDVFVFPSWVEGSSKAIFEAMACGLPVIVTSSSGSVVRDGVDGFVIEPGDLGALREKMLWFKQHPERIRAMGEQARARAGEFSWDRYADAVIAMYTAARPALPAAA